MKFSRLLAAGRSLVGMKETQSPYRMRKGTLLPKFESVKNPFAPLPMSQNTKPGASAVAPCAGQLQIPAARPQVGPVQESLFCEEQLKPVASPAHVSVQPVSAFSPDSNGGEGPRGRAEVEVISNFKFQIPDTELKSEADPRLAVNLKANADLKSEVSNAELTREIKEPACEIFANHSSENVLSQSHEIPAVDSLRATEVSSEVAAARLPETNEAEELRARLVAVHSFQEASRLAPVAHNPRVSPIPAAANAELVIARSGPEIPQSSRDGAGMPAKPNLANPAKPGAVVGLMDSSPLGLKTGVPSKSGQLAPPPVFRPGINPNSNFLAELAKKLNPLSYFTRTAPTGMRTWARPGRNAVQTELSLEKVKVIRNDLSDADLQVVTIQKSAKPAAARLEPARESDTSAFGRLTSRFLEQDHAEVR